MSHIASQYTEDTAYRRLLNRLFDACASRHDCDHCEFRRLCIDVWGVFYLWSQNKWKKETSVARSYLKGKSTRHIAEDQGVSVRTIQRILAKRGRGDTCDTLRLTRTE